MQQVICSVLCIEDNPANMLVVQRILESKAFKLIKAESGEEGIELARHYHPDLILVDINLPGIDGLTVTRTMKQETALRNIPVIAVTASSMYSKQDCLAAGCDDYLAKPITMAKFLMVLQKYGIR
jgi:two-component system cell cycle response regulator DivK